MRPLTLFRAGWLGARSGTVLFYRVNVGVSCEPLGYATPPIASVALALEHSYPRPRQSVASTNSVNRKQGSGGDQGSRWTARRHHTR